jgi:radical SAM superfamily enzyme YgiQ (UPF0313 family)
MKNKILLVSANTMKDPYPVYPLGISYLHAYLEKQTEDFHIRIFDFIEQSYDEYVETLKDYKPDFIGISLRNADDVNVYLQRSFIEHYRQIVEHSRDNSEAVIILGGSGYSIFPELLFERIQPDFGIYGEGEHSLYLLLRALQQDADVSSIPNLIYQKGPELIFNKHQQKLKEIDLSFHDDMVNYYWQHSGMLNIQTKRGCPYRCIYCTYPVIEGHNVRTLNAEQIVDQLEYLQREKHIDYVFFTDSVFNIDNKFNLRLAEMMIKRKLNIKWGAYFNFCNIDKELLTLMKKAGLAHIEFGTDSLSEEMLKNYRKPFTVNDIIRISDLCAELEIDYAHFLILAGNGETENTINETFENSKLLKRTVFFPFIGLRIYPGTALYDIAVQEGKIEKDDDLLLPKYYISDPVNIDTLKERALQTGRRWVFPDDDLSKIMTKMRSRGKKGPLWEYLIQ